MHAAQRSALQTTVSGSAVSVTMDELVSDAMERGDPTWRAPRSPRTVLIVEDEADIREAFGEMLAREGYGVAFAGNGEEAGIDSIVEAIDRATH